MSRWLTALALAAGLTMWPPTLAWAGPGDGSGQGTGGSQADVLIASATLTTAGSTSAAGELCSWQLVEGGIAVSSGVASWPFVRDGVVHHLWLRTCGTQLTFVDVPESTPSDLLPSILHQLKERVLPKPAPVFELLDPEFGWAYVRTALDFRSGADSWKAMSVTASLGPVWATVTALPTRLTFDPGDPAGNGPVSCAGDGPVAPYVPATPGVCSYTYTNASSTSPFDGYHFQTTLSIDWSLSWTSSTGAGGVLEPYTTSATSLLAVAEVKGLVTCTGPRPEQGGC